MEWLYNILGMALKKIVGVVKSTRYPVQINNVSPVRTQQKNCQKINLD